LERGGTMKDDKCSVNRCRGRPTLTYLGKRLCDKHWLEVCKEERGCN